MAAWGAQAAAPAAGGWGAAADPAAAWGAANGGAWGASNGGAWGAAYGAAAPVAAGWGGAWGKGGKGGKGMGGNRFQPYGPKRSGLPTTSVKLQPLPEGVDEAQIREVFTPFGEIQSVRVMAGQPNYAYVNYTTTQAAAAAVALNNVELAGAKVYVHAGRPKYPDATESIGLFNIPFTTTQEEIEKLVTPHAGFKKLKMITKPGTTEFRGFCFVDFESVENAITALEALQGTWVGNKAIDVKFASGPGGNQSWGKGGKGGDQWGGAGAWGAPAMWGQQVWGGGW
eukprot:GGOE01058996.1.p1 GENE.GGOE01058996.1~~GGOE01058996.1.p1  ORF type:complete len:302 (-),score=78.03 GGOE01058996.1:492-1343(-)